VSPKKCRNPNIKDNFLFMWLSALMTISDKTKKQVALISDHDLSMLAFVFTEHPFS